MERCCYRPSLVLVSVAFAVVIIFIVDAVMWPERVIARITQPFIIFFFFYSLSPFCTVLPSFCGECGFRFSECWTIFDSWIKDDLANCMQNYNTLHIILLIRCVSICLPWRQNDETLKWKLSLRIIETNLHNTFKR